MSTSPRQKWIKRRSELEGFEWAVYRSDESGDYIRADVSIKEKKVRLTVEDKKETRYHSLIAKGKIEREWSPQATVSRVSAMMHRKAPQFARIPHQGVYRLIKDFYGIGKVPVVRNQPRKKKNHRGVMGLIILLIILIAATVVLSIFL